MSEKVSVKRKWIPSEKIMDFDEAAKQFMHAFNFQGTLFGENAMKEIESQLLEAGWQIDEVQRAQRRGLQMSNWNKNSYIKHRVEGTGAIPFEVSR